MVSCIIAEQGSCKAHVSEGTGRAGQENSSSPEAYPPKTLKLQVNFGELIGLRFTNDPNKGYSNPAVMALKSSEAGGAVIGPADSRK